jgi:predicted TIM-barrel fold metal-dependent hydrolase
MQSTDSAAASAGGTSKPPRIDIHHHFYPPRYLAEAATELGFIAPVFLDMIRRWTPAQSLEALDRTGMDKALLSMSAPGVAFGGVAAGRALARHCNEFGARMASDHPGRFGLFAVLPLPDVEGSLAELDFAYDQLGCEGIGVLTSYDRRWITHPDFAPVLAALNERQGVLFIHPTTPEPCKDLIPGVADATVEFLFDTARVITSMLFDGTATRYPGIRFVFCHAGGAFPPMLHRVARSAEAAPDAARNLPQGALHALRRFYYDIATSAGSTNLGALLDFADAGRILFGSDYPFMAPGATFEPLRQFGRAAEHLDGIAGANSAALLDAAKRGA